MDPVTIDLYNNMLIDCRSGGSCDESSACYNQYPHVSEIAGQTTTDSFSACPAGQYVVYENTGIYGAYSICKECPVGTYNNMRGLYPAVLQSRKDYYYETYLDKYKNKDTCFLCKPGTYQDSVGAASVNSCKVCPWGKFQFYYGGSSCIDCQQGTFNNDEFVNEQWYSYEKGPNDYSVPEYQLMVTFQYQSPVRCLPCLNGQYSEYATGSTICLTCQAGKYPKGLASSCMSCSPGTYSTEVGARDISTCKECPFGTTSYYSASTSCVNCQPGYYGNYLYWTSHSECQPCPSGTFSNVEASSTCQTCDAGSYSINARPEGGGGGYYGGTACYDCAVGKTLVPFIKSSDLSNPYRSIDEILARAAAPGGCTNCTDKLTYAPRAKSPMCYNCTLCTGSSRGRPPYNFMTSDCNVTHDRLCGGLCTMKSQYNEYFVSWCNSTHDSTFSTCSQCPSGKYISGGCRDDTEPIINMTGRNTNQCTSCPAGTYSEAPSWLKGTCKPCQAGKYSREVGAIAESTCLSCARGTFATGGKTACSVCKLSCNAGTYQTYQCNSTHDIGCVPCNKCQTNLNPIYANRSNEYFKYPCKNNQDTTCARCSNCSSGQYVFKMCWDGYNTECRYSLKKPIV
jgi:hypothetical protein